MKFVFVVFCLESIAFGAQEVRGRNSSLASNSTTEFVAPSLLGSSVDDEETDDVAQLKDRLIRESAAEVPAWSPQSSLLLSAIRNLLLEATSSSDVTSQPSAAKQVDGEKIFKTLDRIFGRPRRTTTAEEATSSNVSFETVASESTTGADSSPPVGTSSEPPSSESDLGSETAEGFQASTSVSSEGSADPNGPCRRCYSDLQSCVQRCFMKHNCHQLERNARQCPPAPSRMCSPWRPRGQCMEHHECSTPLLCCNDGCVNKCVPGIRRSTQS